MHTGVAVHHAHTPPNITTTKAVFRVTMLNIYFNLINKTSFIIGCIESLLEGKCYRTALVSLRVTMCKQKRKTRLQVPRPNGNQPLVQLGNSVYYIVMGEKKVYALILHSVCFSY